MKAKKFISLLLVAVLCVSMFPNVLGTKASAIDNPMTVELEFYEYTPGSTQFEPGTVGDEITDLDNINLGDTFVAAIHYTGMNQAEIAPYGVSTIRWGIQYDYEYLEPLHIKITSANGSASTFELSNVFLNNEKIPLGAGYSFQQTDNYVSNTTREAIAIIAAGTGITEENILPTDGYVYYFAFQAKKAGETPVLLPDDLSGNASGIVTYDGPASTSQTYENKTAADLKTQSLLTTTTSYNLTIVNKSAEAVLPIPGTADYVRTLGEDDKFTSDSQIVIRELTPDDGATTTPITEGTKAALYEVGSDGTETLVGTEITAASGEDGTYTLTIPLAGLDDKDYVLKVTEPDKDPSDGVNVYAASLVPIVEDENIAKAINIATGNLSDTSRVRIYALTGNVPVNDDTVIKVYDVDAGGTALKATTASDVRTDDDGEKYVDVVLGNMEDKVYYLSAVQGDRPESLGRAAVDKLVSARPVSGVVENNFGSTDANKTTGIVVSELTKREGVNKPIPSGTVLRVYSVTGTEDSKAPGTEIVDVTIEDVTNTDGELTGRRITFNNKDAMGENGTEYYISAVEPGCLESEKILVGAKVSGSEVKGTVDEEGKVEPDPDPNKDPDLSDEDLEKLESLTDSKLSSPIYIPEGTAVEDLDDYGIIASGTSGQNVVFFVDPAIDDGAGGTTNLVVLPVTWDIDTLKANPIIVSDAFKLPDGVASQDVVLNGTISDADLSAKGVKLDTASYTPHVTLRVIKPSTITLTDGNTSDDDIAAVSTRTKKDIFVYNTFTFTDPGFTVTRPGKGDAGADLVMNAADVPAADLVRTVYAVASDGSETKVQDLAAYSATESLDMFKIEDSTAEASKTFKLVYTYTDPDTGLISTAVRMVYVIFQRGDLDRDNVVGLSDYQMMLNHNLNLTIIDVTDPLYFEKTANVDMNDPESGLTLADYQTMLNYNLNLTSLTQDYTVEDTTMKFGVA